MSVRKEESDRVRLRAERFRVLLKKVHYGETLHLCRHGVRSIVFPMPISMLNSTKRAHILRRFVRPFETIDQLIQPAHIRKPMKELVSYVHQ